MKKKIINILISLLLGLLVLPMGNSFNNANADSYYPMACNVDEFEVSEIKNDGSLSKISCHSNFPDAKAAMKANEDYVVRYEKSYSPTKIVAMNSGVAYTYPGRKNSPTMYLYQNISAGINNRNNYKYTYLTDCYEMTYYDTLSEYSSSLKDLGKGFIKISMNGFDGYCELEYTDLVPTKYLEKGIGIYVGGNNTYKSVAPYKIILKQNYYAIEKNGNYYDLVFHYFCDIPDGNNCYSNEIHVDNATNYLNAGMKVGVKYYSNDGINFYSDTKFKNLVAQVYGYYQFLSVRSKTNISAKTFNNFLASQKSSSQMMNQGQAFINAQNNYGSNALIIYSMACLESGYGTSYYADDRCNLFGWGAYDSDPGQAKKYESIEQCVNQQMGRNLDWFMDCTNWRYAGTCVGNKGTGFNMQYASDPYWGIKIAAIAYRIDKYANNNNGNLSDYNSYTIGVVDSNYNPAFGINTANWNTPIYKDASGTSVMHYSKFNNNYQKDLTVAITEKTGNRYKINLANPIVNGAMYVDDAIVGYDWNTSVGYIDTSRVTVLNASEIKSNATYEPFSSLRSIDITNNKLHISGLGGIQGMDFNADDGSIKHEILFHDAENEDNVYTFNATNSAIDGYSLNDGYNYKFIGFNLELDLSNGSLPLGSYYLSLRTTKSNKSYETVLRSPIDEFSNICSKNGNDNYRITTNYLYGYRVELDLFKSSIDYSTITKPSTRQSLVSFDDISISEEGILNVNGHGLIYYLDFDNVEDIAYQVLLVDKDGNTYELNTELSENKYDYKTQLGSSRNLDHISFKSSIDMNDKFGEFDLILKIKNGDYIDYVEFVNMAGMDMPKLQNDVFDIQILTSNIRNRLYVLANEVEIEGE